MSALSTAELEWIAQRTAELVRADLAALLGSPTVDVPASLVDVATVARALGTSTKFIRAHALELGGRQVVAGGPWRFSLAVALAPNGEGVDRAPLTPEPRKPRPRTTQTTSAGVALLPIRGEAVNGR
jgi:hypothetical protein